MLRFYFTAPWIPGKNSIDFNALSRAPTSRPQEADELAEGPTTFTPGQALINAIEASEETTIDPVLEKIAAAATAHPVMKKAMETVEERFPNDKGNMEPELRQFWDVRNRLAIDAYDGLIVSGHRVVNPQLYVKVFCRIWSICIKGPRIFGRELGSLYTSQVWRMT